MGEGVTAGSIFQFQLFLGESPLWVRASETMKEEKNMEEEDEAEQSKFDSEKCSRSRLIITTSP